MYPAEFYIGLYYILSLQEHYWYYTRVLILIKLMSADLAVKQSKW